MISPDIIERMLEATPIECNSVTFSPRRCIQELLKPVVKVQVAKRDGEDMYEVAMLSVDVLVRSSTQSFDMLTYSKVWRSDACILFYVLNTSRFDPKREIYLNNANSSRGIKRECTQSSSTSVFLLTFL